jgi:hypothetical protein
MWPFERKNDPARPQPTIPRREITIGDITFQWKSLGGKGFYHWWTCGSCGTEIGACNYQGNLRGAILKHLRECESRQCGEPSCVNCVPMPVVTT